MKTPSILPAGLTGAEGVHPISTERRPRALAKNRLHAATCAAAARSLGPSIARCQGRRLRVVERTHSWLNRSAPS